MDVRNIDNRFNVVFVLGPPGSGKGTQCQKIEKDFGFVHLSAGDLLRAEGLEKNSEYGELIEKHIREGSIVPVEITCRLLLNAMLANSSETRGFLVDGFPRNRDNLDGWQREMNEKVRVHFVLHLAAPIEVCVQRCLNRGQGRSDDNLESMQKRIQTYNNQTVPIIDYYNRLNLVRQIDSSKTADEVYAEIVDVFEAAGFQRK